MMVVVVVRKEPSAKAAVGDGLNGCRAAPLCARVAVTLGPSVVCYIMLCFVVYIIAHTHILHEAHLYIIVLKLRVSHATLL